MDFFRLNTAGDLNDASLCLVDAPPEGMEEQDFRMSVGRPVGEHYPDDAKIYLKDEHPGIKLAGLLGNTKGYFLASKTAQEVIEEMCDGIEIEFLPFTLYNQKRRVHSKDYVFINPIGGFDCLNEKASGVVYDKEGDVLKVKQYILDPKKIAKAPHLFRIAQDPIEYVISKALGETLSKRGVTNVRAVPLKVQG